MRVYVIRRSVCGQDEKRLAEDPVPNWESRWRARRPEQVGVYRVVQPSELKLRPLAANARRPAHPLLVW